MKKKLLKMSLTALILGCTMNAAQAQWNIAGININNTNTGNVGVGTGTTALPAKLTVQGSGGTPAVGWVNSGAPLFAGFGEQITGNADYILSMASSLAGGRPVFIGRRSKGTLATPQTVANNDYLMSFLASGYDGAAFQNPAGIDFYVDGTPTSGNVPTRISFVTGTNSSTRAERLKIGNTGDITMNTNQFFLQKSTGNVGIGTTTPIENFVVSEPAGAVAGTQNFLLVETVVNPFVPSNQGVVIRKDDGQKRGFKLFQDGSDDGNSVFKIASFSGGGDIDRLTIKRDNGNVGIGTTTPIENLVVSEPAGATAGTQNFLLVETVVNPFVPSNQGVVIRKDDGQKRGFKLFQDGSDDGNSVFKIASFSGGSDIDRLTVKRDNGNVGIGTSAPTANLSVNGTANNTTGAWGVFSDSRVKKVNADFTDGLNVIKQIRTIKFNYNEKAPFNAQGEQIGVVAQELEKIAPYMVSKKAMGDIKDLREVNNQAYPFLLINAVKELAAENDELKKQNTEMKNDIAAIKAMLQGSNAKNVAAINQRDVSFETAYLKQNIPNPPAGNFTKINYNIPTGAARAEMMIMDNGGRKIKTISLNTFGKGVLNVDTKGLATGTYSYSMVVDGKVVDTKQMIVVK